MKPKEKILKIILTAPELEDYNGDKKALFLSLFQNELKEIYIVQYGQNYKSLLIYESGTTYPSIQLKMPVSFARFIKSDARFAAIRFRLPISFLYEVNMRLHLSIMAKIDPLVCGDLESCLDMLKEVDRNKYIIRFVDGKHLLHKITGCNEVGVRYRSQMR